jgi:hypothetical protein
MTGFWRAGVAKLQPPVLPLLGLNVRSGILALADKSSEAQFR